MSTSWNGQISHKEKDFRIQFQTDDYEKYKKIEKLCQELMDAADEEYYDKVLRDMESIVKSIVPEQHVTEPCKNCPNHPINSGSGLCNCTLGQSPINYTTENYSFEVGV